MEETKAQEYQTILYNLFQKYILSIEGQISQVGSNVPEMYIPKSVVSENMIQLLNEFGEEISKEEVDNEEEQKPREDIVAPEYDKVSEGYL